MDILDKISSVLGEEISKYSKRRVKHGRKRSTAGRLQGADKRKYLKSLKDKKRKYKGSAATRSKVKRKRKKYLKTSGAKQAKRLYKKREA